MKETNPRQMTVVTESLKRLRRVPDETGEHLRFRQNPINALATDEQNIIALLPEIRVIEKLITDKTVSSLIRDRSKWVFEELKSEASDSPKTEPILTPQQIQVLSFITEGKTNKKIASTLEISIQTVKNHMTNINSRLGSSNRTEAVKKALQHGIINLEQDK